MRISLYSLSAAPVFLGAFLLFVIQPIASKELLPFFGGSSSVWSTSLLFFSGMLSVGYLYVYLVTRLSPRTQLFVHLVAVVVSAVVSSVVFFGGYDAFFSFGPEDIPALKVLITLLLWIGAPYILLSTTGPLMQYWYGSATGKEPYTLFALSNTASLAALLSYPFLVEPYVSLQHQERIWFALFLVYVFLITVSAGRFFKAGTSAQRESEATVTPREAIVWILLAALPAFVLVATTTHITQAISPVPLLWVVPLSIYLVSFIIAFAGRGQWIYTPLLFFASALVAWWFTPASYDTIVLQVLSYVALLFFCGLSCHVLLYQAKPGSSSLPLFYLFLSVGGAVGALFASIAAPLIFNDFHEFALGLALSGGLAMWILPNVFFPRILEIRHIFIVKAFFTLLAMSLFIQQVTPEDFPMISSRNFYGNAKIFFESEMVSLMHGTTLHGTQYARAEDARLPTTYFTPGSGVGRAILFEQGIRRDGDMRVGIIGLGAGTIAAYCRGGDMYVFYEIDARIERIARTYFSYLSHCKGAEVRIGDGRVSLKEEETAGNLGNYDVLAVDAFSDDTIPVHLLTLEAFKTYLVHLRAPESILALHISNRYLNLAPVVFRLAAELDFNAMLVSDAGESTPGGSPSAWVLLSKGSNVFRSVAFANANASPPAQTTYVWTDDYSSLLPVIDLPWPWE